MMRRKPRRKGERLIDFLNCRVVIFFVFRFLLSLDCRTGLTAIQFRVELGTILMRLPKSSPHFRLTRRPSWIWRSRKAVSQRSCSPTDFLSPAEDALKRRVDVIESTITSSPESRIWDFSPMGSGTAKTRFDRIGAT